MNTDEIYADIALEDEMQAVVVREGFAVVDAPSAIGCEL